MIAEALNEVKAHIERDGYHTFRGLISPDIQSTVLSWLERFDLLAEKCPGDLEPELEQELVAGRPFLRKIRRLVWFDNSFWTGIFRELELAEIAKELVGPRSIVIRHAAFMKPAKIGSEVAPHQDQALWNRDYPGALTLWIALSPATVENGCLVGYPGSHSKGVLPHRRYLSYRWHPSISPNEQNIGIAKPVELEAGDAVVWHRYFVHSSGPNRSDLHRRGMVLVVADGEVPRFQAPDQFPLS